MLFVRLLILAGTVAIGQMAVGQVAERTVCMTVSNPGPERITILMRSTLGKRRDFTAYPVKPGRNFRIHTIRDIPYDFIVRYHVSHTHVVDYGLYGFMLADAIGWQKNDVGLLELPPIAEQMWQPHIGAGGIVQYGWVPVAIQNSCSLMIECANAGGPCSACTLQSLRQVASSCSPTGYPPPRPIPPPPKKKTGAMGG